MFIILEMKGSTVLQMDVRNINNISVIKASNEPGCGFPDNTRILKLQLNNGIVKYIKAENTLIKFMEGN